MPVNRCRCVNGLYYNMDVWYCDPCWYQHMFEQAEAALLRHIESPIPGTTEQWYLDRLEYFRRLATDPRRT